MNSPTSPPRAAPLHADCSPMANSSARPLSSEPRNDQQTGSSATEDGGSRAEAEETRRAMMASAIAGLQRFKQSYLSIMVLKAGIGLGQVIALITLLILASTLSSPLYPSQKQRDGSAACPHPGLFEAWCITQIIRLATCWSVSVWMLVRRERTRRSRADLEAAESAAEETAALARQELARRLASTRRVLPSTSSPPSEGTSTPPSLSHADGTSSVASGSLSGRSRDTSTDGNLVGGAMDGELPAMGETQVTKPHDLDIACQGQNVAQWGLQQARDLADGHQISSLSGEHSAAPPTSTGFAGWLDRNALRISQSLGILSLILFILGNILLFYPPPTRHSCYAASPMLWWGVMTVTAVGWVLFAQVFFVVVIVGLGGHVALSRGTQRAIAKMQSALRRAGLSPPPLIAHPERPPQPDPLIPSELAQLPVVCFVPLDDDKATYDPSRLPYPPHPLASDKALCAICQENFRPPEEGRTIMIKADPLRLLGCGHVFHWLLQGSGNCPFCNRSVRDTTISGKEGGGDVPRSNGLRTRMSV